MSIMKAILDNGLTVLGEPNVLNQSTAIGFFVKTGSRDETKKESGVSHFLEHMMFKGTNTRTALDLTYALGNIGAQANAFTSEENTVYYGSVLPEYLDTMQELLSDMLRPKLDINEFETEKKVILEEIALYADKPQFYLFTSALEDYFGGHPCGNSVLGTVASVSQMTRDEMLAYFERRYSPSNMALVVSGKFDWDHIVEKAADYCGAWKNFPVTREIYPADTVSRARVFKKKNIQQSHVLLISKGPSASEEERFAFAVLATIIGDATGSRLYWEIVDKGLAEGAGADNDERLAAGCFLAFASTEPKNLDKVGEIMRRIVSSSSQYSAADLERARTKLISRIVLNGELPLGRLHAIGHEWLYREKIPNLKEVIARVKAVSMKEISSALERYPLDCWSEYRLVPD